MQKYFEINEEGHNIRCKLYAENPKNIRKAVLFAHGFGGHKDNGAAQRFAEYVMAKYRGIAVITFNFPCHGDDVKKKFSLADCIRYLELCAEYIRKEFTEEINIYATSFGGYVVLNELALHGNSFRKIVLRCPALNMYESFMGRILKEEDLEKLRKGKEAPAGFDRKVMVGNSFIEELRENDLFELEFLDYADDILILHGTEDEVVPFEVSKRFCEDNVIEFVPVPGADHRFRNPKHMDLAIKAIVEFFGF